MHSAYVQITWVLPLLSMLTDGPCSSSCASHQVRVRRTTSVMPESHGQNQACLQNLPTELKKLVLQHLQGEATEPEDYELGALTEYQTISHRLTRTCRSWRRLLLPDLYCRLSLLASGGRSLPRLEALRQDKENLAAIRCLKLKILRSPVVAAAGDPPTAVRHAEEDYLLSTIIIQCTELVTVYCETDHDCYDNNGGHFPSILHALSMQQQIRAFFSAQPTTALHILCFADILRVLPGVERAMLTGPLHPTTQDASSKLDFARNQLARALAHCASLSTLDIDVSLLPATPPVASANDWKPRLGRLTFRTRPIDVDFVSSRSWFITLCVGSTRNLSLHAVALPATSALLSQNAHTTALQSLVVKSGARHPFGLRDLDVLSTIKLISLKLTGPGSADLTAHVLRHKSCAMLRKITLSKCGQDPARTASLRYIREWAAGRQGRVVIIDEKPLAHLEL